jgi:hypothetical protein
MSYKDLALTATNDDFPSMDALIRKSLQEFNKLSPAEKEAALAMQRESFARNYRPGDRQAICEAPQDDLASYVKDHRAWSEQTFIGTTAVGITKHIEKECIEVRAKPDDLEEWIDMIILSIDGYWRHGGVPEELLPRLRAKQRKNMSRKWVSTGNPDEPVEHDRSDEVAA